MAQDFYETLQVHPKADREAIDASYRRLRDLYSPERLQGVAEELVSLARQKRDDIERAYAVLSDPLRRAAYDTELAAEKEAQVAPSVQPRKQAAQVLDYRPLPPAGRSERGRDFDPRPVRTATTTVVRERGRRATEAVQRRWIAPAIIGGLVAVVVAVSVTLAGTRTGVTFTPPPASTPSPLDQFETTIPQARQVAEQNAQDPQALIQYANALYDSVQVVREIAPDSPTYQQRMPRWLEATQVYSKALVLDPNNTAVRSDMGASSCFYGAGTGDTSYIQNGTAEARRALATAPKDERVLYNLSQCLLSSQPPQTDEALKHLKDLVQNAPQSSSYAVQARELITKYENQ